MVELAFSNLVQGTPIQEKEVSQRLPLRNCFFGIIAVPVHAVSLSLGRTAARAMEAAHIPARHGRGPAGLLGALGRCSAARAAVARKGSVHGVDPEFP